MNDQTAIRNRDVKNVLTALNSLDGRQEMVKTVVGGKEVVLPNIIPYKLGGRVRLLCASWLSATKDQQEKLQKAHDALVREYVTPESPTQVPEAKLDAFTADWDKVLDDTTSFPIDKISADDLHVEENQLPISILCVLRPILT